MQWEDSALKQATGNYFVVWCDKLFLQKKEVELFFIEKEGFDFLGEGKKPGFISPKIHRQ